MKYIKLKKQILKFDVKKEENLKKSINEAKEFLLKHNLKEIDLYCKKFWFVIHKFSDAKILKFEYLEYLKRKTNLKIK